MKFTSIITLFAMSLSFCGTVQAADSSPTSAGFVRKLQAGDKQTVVYYGTSLTAAGAWTRLLTNRLKEAYPGQVAVHNSGGPGMHSGWGLQNLNERVIALKPDVVFIEFSINDAVARFNLSPERGKANLEKMIDRIQAAQPGCEIILQIMNPVIDKSQGDSGWRPTLEACQQNYRDVARERGLLLVDHMPAWSRVLENDEPIFRGYVPDGVHPSEDGWREIVMPELLRRLGL